jgi:sugar/nucleoside kinase (ribokinase family)
MRNKFLTPDRERRISTALSIADPFKSADIPEVTSRIYHLAGLLYGEFDENIIIELSQRGKVAVDVQGFLRHADHVTGSMFYKDWDDKKALLPYIYFFKTDAAEAEILTGTANLEEAIEILYGWGAREVIITHNKGVMAYSGEKIYSCPIKARNLSGRPGRGDTTFAAYTTERLHADIPQALLWATAMVSHKMETPGPYKGTRADVENYIKAFYKEGF